MTIYEFLTGLYGQFISLFPEQIRWLVTLILVIAIISAFVALIRFNAVFIIILIILLPVLIPVFRGFFTDIYNFFLYLLQSLGNQAPNP